jgi:outer membrane biogenesis lipoprotein LolB
LWHSKSLLKYKYLKRGDLMVRFVLFTLLAILLLTACSPAATGQPAAESQEKPLVTVYREPT